MSGKDEEYAILEEIEKRKKQIYAYIQLVRVLLTLKLYFERRYSLRAFIEPSVAYEGKGVKEPDLLVLTSSNTAIIFDHKIIGTPDIRTVRSQLVSLNKYYGILKWRGKEHKVLHAILLCSKESWNNVLRAGLIEKPITWIYELVEDKELCYKFEIYVPKGAIIEDDILRKILNVYRKHNMIKIERPREAMKYVFIREPPPDEYVVERVYRFLYARMDANVDEDEFYLREIVEDYNKYYPPWVLESGEAQQLTMGRLIKALKIMDKIGLAKYKPNEGVVIVKKIKKLSGDMLDYLLEKIIKQEFEEKKRRPKVKKQTRITNFFK